MLEHHDIAARFLEILLGQGRYRERAASMFEGDSMGQRESRISQEIAKVLRLNGVFVFKIHGGPTMMAGLPDLIACVDGKFVGFETKVPEKRTNVSPVQQLVHGKIRKAGGLVYVVCGPQEAMAKVTEIREGKTQG